jgi:hypothetical protein
METVITVAALCIAIWQLKLQRDEIRRSSRVNSLIHIAGLLRDKIQHHEQIIESLKLKKSDWTGHAHRVNSELRPQLSRINNELIESIPPHAGNIDVQGIRQALKLSGEQGAIQ